MEISTVVYFILGTSLGVILGVLSILLIAYLANFFITIWDKLFNNL